MIFSRSIKRRTALAGLLATTGVALTACGGDSGPAEDAGTGSAEAPVSLTVLVNDAYVSQWTDNLVPEFNKEFPHIKVTLDGVPYNDMLAKTMLELTNLDPTYDVVMADDSWTPQLASTGGLVDLRSDTMQEWTADDYDWDDFYPAAVAAGQYEGTQYAVPVRSNILMMLYNKTLYSEAGLPEPTSALTWDEFLAQAPQLLLDQDGDGETDAWAVGTYFVRDSLTPTIWQTIMNSNGGSILNEDNTSSALGPEAAEALAIHQELLDYAPPGALSWQFNEPLEAFRQGRLATMFNWGSVYYGSAVDESTTTLTPEEVGLVTMPAGSVGPGAHRGVWSMGVNSRSSKQQAGWAFSQWISSKKGELWQANNIGVFPARASTLNSEPEEAWLGVVFEALKEAWPAIEEGQMWRPQIVESDAVQQILATETGELIPGNITADEAVERMTDSINELLG